MARPHDTMMNPPIEELLDRVDSKFPLVTLAAKRARQINSLLQPARRRPRRDRAAAGRPRSPASRCRSPSRRSPPTRSPTTPIERRGRGRARRSKQRRSARGRRVDREAAVAAGHRSPCSPGDRIVLGVTGGIAAYKAVEVCRRLVDAGAHVVPVMTDGATRFVGAHHLLGPGLRAGADLAVGRAPTRSRTPGSARPPTSSSSCPATARLLGAYAAGISDDLLDRDAARHPGAGGRVPGDAHRDVGAPGGAGQPGHAAPPRRARRRARGRAASPAATSAPVAWPSPSDIVAAVERRARRRRTSPALRVLVTAGGTREPIDPVRVISNRSSGKQGHALADEAARPRRRGHARHHRRPAGRRRASRSSRSRPRPRWRQAVLARPRRADVVVMAAAVADFRPEGRRRPQDQEGRRRRPRSSSSRPPTSSPASARAKRPGQTLVGFAAETDDAPRPTPRASSRRKHLDLIVANDVVRPRRRASSTTPTRS